MTLGDFTRLDASCRLTVEGDSGGRDARARRRIRRAEAFGQPLFTTWNWFRR